MIDLHIHILPGLDDGPPDISGTLALAQACVEDGVRAVAATPHVSADHPTRPRQLAEALQHTRQAIASAGLPLEVLGGAEIAIDQLSLLSDQELLVLTLGQSGAYLLVETPYSAWPASLEDHLGRLAKLGVRAILAHPERSAGVQEPGGLKKLESAVARGVYAQVTAGSLAGRFGRTAQATARSLIERDLVHLIASDAHNVDRRPPRMSEAVAAIEDPALAHWLTEAAPDAILRGQRLPPRPISEPSRGRSGIIGRLRRAR